LNKTEKNITEMVILSDPENIKKVEAKTERLAKRIGFSEDELDSLAISVTEIVANAIYHGNKRDHTKRVFIKFVSDARSLKIYIRDEGPGFNPAHVANPLAPENIFKESGRGIFIVKTLMDDVRFKFCKKGTEIILTKKVKCE
jgi:serine/threonine-protein kinase RsbW